MTSPRARVLYLEILDESFSMFGIEVGLWRANVPPKNLNVSLRRLKVTLEGTTSPL
jgi:hypothetical protein